MKKRTLIAILTSVAVLLTASTTAFAVEPTIGNGSVPKVTEITQVSNASPTANDDIILDDNSTEIIVATEPPTEAPAPLPQLTVTNRTMGVNERCNLTDFIAKNLNVKDFRIRSNKTTVARIDSDTNQIVAVGVGKATIYVINADGVKKSFTITVTPAPTQIHLNKTSITLGVGETFDLNSSFKNGENAYRIDYSTTNSSVATVARSGGLVTAKMVGATTITATTYNGKKVTCTVKVKKAPTQISLNKTSVTLGVGETFDLNSKLNSNEASYSIRYASSNSNIATVNSSGGLVTAKKAGTVTISATTYNGKKVTCKVTVKNAPSKISLNKTKLTLGVGETFDLNSSLPTGTASYIVKYKSTNSSVATVKSSGGLVTAKKVGTATVTATTYNGKSVTCTITVKSAPTSIYLNKNRIVLKVGQTYDLNSLLKTGEAAHSIVYTSKNTSIATVKASGGLVTAKKAGTTTVTATTYNGKKATCTVVITT